MEAYEAYEAHAQEFLSAREKSLVGRSVAAQWAASLEPRSEVLEIACGGGFPVTQALIEAGHCVWAMDASPSLVAVFQSRFPNIPVQCSTAQTCDFFPGPSVLLYQ